MTSEHFLDIVHNNIDDADNYDELFDEIIEQTRWGHVRSVVIKHKQTGVMLMGNIDVTSGDRGGSEVFDDPVEVEILSYRQIPVFTPVKK